MNTTAKIKAEEPTDIFPSLVNLDSSGNHIYFYDEVNDVSVMKLNKMIRDLTTALLVQSQNGLEEPCLYLHINSPGGSVFSAFSTVDTIMTAPVKVITIVEGCAASGATLISAAGHVRLIHKHAHMLIHQLSTAFWGKHNEFQDEMKNQTALMQIIKNFYIEKTKIPEKSIEEILSHDIYLDADSCVLLGLVDTIIGCEEGSNGDGKKAKPKTSQKTQQKKVINKPKPARSSSASRSGNRNNSVSSAAKKK